jgi:hypothetical protein
MIEITRIEKAGGPLTKRIYLGEDGRLVSDGSACTMSSGRAERVAIKSLSEVANLIGALTPSEAITVGRLRDGLPNAVSVTTHSRLASLNGTAPPDLIARTADFIRYAPGRPALALLDIDTKGMPDDVKARIRDVGGFWSALCRVLPQLATTGRILRRSTSTGISRADTGEVLPGSNGMHIYVSVQDGADIERFLRTLHDRCWLHGFGWHMVGAGGQLLDRSLVDRMVYAAERLVFEGAPVLVEPLVQDLEARRAVVHEGVALDTKEGCPPLRIVEAAELKTLKAKSAHALAPVRAAARETFIASHAETLAARAKITPQQARRIIERQCEGILLPDLVLPWDDEGLAACTVADVLADPARFVGATLADPLEGAAYGRTKARIMRRADGTPWINSFAHGRTVYELRFDARAATAAVAEAGGDNVTETFVKVAVQGDLDADEIEDLRNRVSETTGIGKRALTAKLRAAQQAEREQGHREAKDRRTAERKDARPQVPAPAPDAPWLPVMEALNDVLSASQLPEPPMRDIDGAVTQVRVRRIPNMHALTPQGSNEGEREDTRLPAPEQPLLTRLDEPHLAELIERHIDFIDDKGRSIHLGSPFVRHYLARGDEALPVVSAIATLPIVMPDGALLSRRGLDRNRGIVFRVPGELLSLVPQPTTCTNQAVAEAMRFLTEEWLVDVAADYIGKAILIAAALTIIERSVLPERPAFFVTAGRRGGGKTTALIMLLVAVTGTRPSAAAWSPNEEERRKSLLSYLLEALPAIVWDNIPRGTQISCPHIEKSCTTAFYSDRRLGVSEMVAISSSVVHLFTGNNIGPRGDLASRSLQVRLEVDRADPENREFRHSDPVGWTEANRGRILRALYTILLGNPALQPSSKAKPETRFKTWWRLVGSAVENAAKLHAASVADRVAAMVEDPPAKPPVAVNFCDLFLLQEEDDEENASLADALAALAATEWPQDKGGKKCGPFQAAHLARGVNDQSEYRPDTERERSTIVREFLFPSVPNGHSVTPKAVGKRLNKHVGEPVARGDTTMTLKRWTDAHTKQTIYCVEVNQCHSERL